VFRSAVTGLCVCSAQQVLDCACVPLSRYWTVRVFRSAVTGLCVCSAQQVLDCACVPLSSYWTVRVFPSAGTGLCVCSPQLLLDILRYCMYFKRTFNSFLKNMRHIIFASGAVIREVTMLYNQHGLW
jgi:hypothetical protein